MGQVALILELALALALVLVLVRLWLRLLAQTWAPASLWVLVSD